MKGSFIKNLFQHAFKTSAEKSNITNIDFANAVNHSWIISEHEIQQQSSILRYRTNESYHFRLGDALSQLYDIQKEEISKMHIIFGKEHYSIDRKDEIWDYNIIEKYTEKQTNETIPDIHQFINLIYRNRNKRNVFRGTSNMLLESTIMIHCHPVSQYKKQTAYFNISISIPDFPFPQFHCWKGNDTRLTCRIFTIAYDYATPSQAQAEYNYMKENVDEAELKGYNSLTDAEQLLLKHISPDIGNEFYWGKKAFNDYRYMDAILYLKNVFNNLRDNWYKKGLSSKEMALLTECSYMIGYSYNDMRLYDKAYQYLELAGKANNRSYKYKQELINCMVNSHNLLSIIYIDGFLQDMRNMPDSKRTSEDIHFFYFLLRRKAYILIEMEQLDDAEFILSQLLQKDPDNLVVLKELAYIQHKRKQKDESAQERASKE